MGYRALYRQYRPATFSEVIGQDHITTILKNQVQAGQTAHAYLFAGTRGTGKTSTAKILARAVNCQQPQGGEPCGQCSACQRTQGDHVDIVELDAASNNGVEDIRSILDKVRYTPLELRTKVYIIDEAHALSPNAFNALLKTLEEPPGHVMFILATTEPQRIPATIISRCQRFDFHRLSIGDMTGRMRTVLESAGAVIDPEGLVAIARAAEGGMRDALSLADQCLSFCGDHVTAADVYAVLGSMDGEFLFSMAEALLCCDSAKALTLLDQVIREGRDLRVFLHDLAMHMRALLLAKLCGHCSDILDCTEDAMKRYMAQAETAGEVRLLRASEALLQAESRLKNMALPRVLVESVLVRIARPEEQRTVEDLVERIEALEQRPLAAVQPVSAPQDTQPAPSLKWRTCPPGRRRRRNGLCRSRLPFRTGTMGRNRRPHPSRRYPASRRSSPRPRMARPRSGPRWRGCWTRNIRAWPSWPGQPSGLRWRMGSCRWALTARCFATPCPSRGTWFCLRRCCNRCRLEWS